MEEHDRDHRGRFATGNRGGPGRPRRTVERDYLRAMADAVDLGTWRGIVARAVEDAEAGDAKARTWLSRHLLPGPGGPRPPLQQDAIDDLAGLDPVESEAASAEAMLRILRALG